MYYDITTPLSEDTPVYPGDPPVRIDRLSDVAAGDEFTLSSISTSLHAGSHIDAPSHFIADALSVDEIPLGSLIGPATLVDIETSGAITPAAVDAISLEPNTERILFRTPDGPSDTALGVEAAARLAQSGVRLVGIDRQSIAMPDQESQVHRTLLAAGIVIVECLNLAAPPPGDYELICLPLKITGAEAAPVRAVLTG